MRSVPEGTAVKCSEVIGTVRDDGSPFALTPTRSYAKTVKLVINEKWRKTQESGLAYRTSNGAAYQSKIEEFLLSSTAKKMYGKVQLVITSPPFPLLSPKRYGNTNGEEYIQWISQIADGLVPLLTTTGSLVIEIGNCWNRGEPTMSTVPLLSLLSIADTSGLKICQQFICNNSARLPGPAAWVTRKRIRVKDSFTHVWWYSATEYPEADNRKVLRPYSAAMNRLLRSKTYNPGHRPSDHKINETSFLADNGGAIPSSVFNIGNTSSPKNYLKWCENNGIRPHPARMQPQLVEFFINFLTNEGDRVFDPFAGSNTTGFVAESTNRKWSVVEADSNYLLGSIGRFR
jgi:site-specific DNA-methyltransferase (cytosine-N4-specific)